MALWSGRFETGPAAAFQRFSESLGVDLLMFEEDIAGSMAHATMLGEVGLLEPTEVARILMGLTQVRTELREGTYTPGIELEDVHMAVESRLLEIIGALGGKLHTARSRNDQVATDVRLWMLSAYHVLGEGIQALLSTLLDRVEQDGRTLIPGFTHLQRGQPIWLGHHLLAYCWMLSRDLERLQDARKRLDLCPLGAGAMAGTPHPIDRERSAELMGFGGVVQNAMDAVAARDHLQEAASVCAICMTNLSRMAEELVLWSTPEFGILRMGEAYATGSSIMPQKRNPDAAELVRGKTGRVFGDLQALLTMVKGLPLAYNRDLQEDRHALFDALMTTTASVEMMQGMWSTLSIYKDRYLKELEGDFLLATELADYLASKGVPFRDAHHVSGSLVKWCEERQGNFSLLTLEVLQQHHRAFQADTFEWLELEAAVERRTSLGGTAWCEVERQVALLRGPLCG